MGIPTGGGARERFFFDADSGLLLRYQYAVTTPLGNYPSETDYSDYKSVGGLNLPFTVREAQPQESHTIHYTDVRLNVKVDDSKFQKPAPKPGATPPAGGERSDVSVDIGFSAVPHRQSPVVAGPPRFPT